MKTSTPRILKSALTASAALALVLPLGACRIEQTQEGELPEVDIQAEAGQLPKFDVDGPDVDVSMKETEVAVPDVDVEMVDKKVKVPDIDVTLPKDRDGDDEDGDGGSLD